MRFRCSAFITLLFIFTTSCNEQFNKDKWNEYRDVDSPSPDRDKMLADLTKNHKLVGLKSSALISLLGEPDFTDSNSLTYEIVIKYDMIDPDYIKDLDFTLSKDSTITAFEVKEWHRHS